MRDEVVDLLTRMGAAWRGRGDLRRARAYLRAANNVARTPDFETLLGRGALREIEGVGPSIERTIQDFARTGAAPAWLDEEAAEAPQTRVPAWAKSAPFPDAPDLHCHSTWSDGTLTLEEIVAFARRMGASAIGVSDHSGSLRIARGLRIAEQLLQWDEISRVQARHPDFTILRGTECDILRDGTLDHPEHILTGFDYVIGSLHSQLRLPKKEQTERVLAALDQPYLTALGHPTTAVPGRRPAANLDFEAIFQRAAERGVAMEVNGNPGRLDLPVRLAKQALKAGCKLSLGSDGHSASEMLHIATARRMAEEAGADDDDIINQRVLAAARPRTRRAAARPSGAPRATRR
ncbi:MAG: polymerase [Thermoplasmata archaeon]|jgi:histidinol phosphatase-like PHP family hydrolase|nr:polymerase [Thermoplasmata archaeon]